MICIKMDTDLKIQILKLKIQSIRFKIQVTIQVKIQFKLQFKLNSSYNSLPQGKRIFKSISREENNLPFPSDIFTARKELFFEN